ncbi:MAG: hypothetical protein V3W41_03110 [Planctomycetota bacterium]
MIQPSNIHSLTDFVRRAREHSDRLQESGKPEVLTVNGSAKLVVQSAAAYEMLMDRLEELESLAGIRHGLASMKRSEGRPAVEVLDELRAEFDIPRNA